MISGLPAPTQACQLEEVEPSFIGFSAQEEEKQTSYLQIRLQRDSGISLPLSRPLWGDSCLLLLTLRVQRRQERALETELLSTISQAINSFFH